LVRLLVRGSRLTTGTITDRVGDVVEPLIEEPGEHDVMLSIRDTGLKTEAEAPPWLLASRSGVGPEPAGLAEPLGQHLPTGGPARILIVEDNHDTADSLQMLLEALGHEVRVAYNGPEGVVRAEQWQPEVILSDIGLPGLDGYGVARALRRNPATARVRLIAVTGYGSETDRRQAFEAGFDFHLTKPVDPVVLVTLIRTSPGA
jgi:two-component system CheB/CheR fusion protein